MYCPAFIYSGLKIQFSLKEMFSILSNNDVFFHIPHSYQGEVAQKKTTDSSRTTILLQKSCMHAIYYRSKQCFILLGLKDAYYSRGELPTSAYIHHVFF